MSVRRLVISTVQVTIVLVSWILILIMAGVGYLLLREFSRSLS